MKYKVKTHDGNDFSYHNTKEQAIRIINEETKYAVSQINHAIDLSGHFREKMKEVDVDVDYWVTRYDEAEKMTIEEFEDND